MSLNSSSVSGHPATDSCETTPLFLSASLSFFAAKTVLVLPLCAFVLHLGLQRWRRGHSLQSLSHSEVFTFHLSLLEMFWAPGVICKLLGLVTADAISQKMGDYMFYVTYYGEFFFHVLTCADRYLAVVHPIAYRGLRGARAAKLRGVALATTWLLCFLLSIVNIHPIGLPTFFAMFSLMLVIVAAVSFFTVSVLCALVRPAPGTKGQADQLKLRALHTIAALSSGLWLSFIGTLVAAAVSVSPLLDQRHECVANAAMPWTMLPISLVSPLLYLYRARKLTFGCR